MSAVKFLRIAKNLSTGGLSGKSNTAGAVLVKGEHIVAQSGDRRVQQNNPVATAEMECIRQAGRRSDQAQLTLYSSAYPDMLIAGTILQFSIAAIVIGLPEASNQAIELLHSKAVPVTFLPEFDE
ncbi:MAG: nucleoside deaminase [Gammaproteobacteria bacterium]|nr:nucleoside deaminase [Gammaproteobacteria bacterium]